MTLDDLIALRDATTDAIAVLAEGRANLERAIRHMQEMKPRGAEAAVVMPFPGHRTMAQAVRRGVL